MIGRFNAGGKYRVIEDGVLKGRTGFVTRLRMEDHGAWVNIEGEPIPDSVRAFPADDPHGRGNHVCLYPEDVEPVIFPQRGRR